MSRGEHIKYVAAKTGRIAVNSFHILPRGGGASEGHRRLLASVAEVTALYAALVWADIALRTKANREVLLAAQKIAGIRVARAYRTVSIEALLVLARMVLWDLLASERAERHLRNVNNDDNMARAATMDKWQRQWGNSESQ